MPQAPGDLDFSQESLGTDRIGHIGTQHLDRNRPPVFDVFRVVHDRHASSTEHTLHPIEVGERSLQLVNAFAC